MSMKWLVMTHENSSFCRLQTFVPSLLVQSVADMTADVCSISSGAECCRYAPCFVCWIDAAGAPVVGPSVLQLLFSSIYLFTDFNFLAILQSFHPPSFLVSANHEPQRPSRYSW
ncbi:hypothetical protein LXL04_016076 [Taraxacum kok-saghyz]